MSLNCNEINLILDELDLTGAFIQEIVQPGYDTIAFYTYKEGGAQTILISTAQNSIRINSTEKKIPKNKKPLRFMEFCRSRIKGCRINSVSQIGLERIVKMEVSRRVSIKEKPNEKYNQIKLASSAFNLSNTAVSNSRIKEEEYDENYIIYIKLWNNAANVIVCNEENLILDTMYRRPERKEVKDEFFNPPAPAPEKLPQAEEKFPVREHPEGETFNHFIDSWYSEHAQTMSREALLEKAEKWYSTNKNKKESALKNLEEKMERYKNCGQLKHQGDLILSYAYKIDRDSKFLECEDFESGKTIKIVIDPKKSAQENAAEYYKNYKKAVSGSEDLLRDIENAKEGLRQLEKQYNKIINEENPIKIEQLLRTETLPKQQQKKNHPGLAFTINDWYLLVGRDANENDELLRHHVRGDDMWLHVRDYSGGYVFIKARKGKTVPLDILLTAGNLAVYYSKARKNTKVDLYYTHVKYLRRAKNGPKGLVIPSQEKNLCISPDEELLKKAMSCQAL